MDLTPVSTQIIAPILTKGTYPGDIGNKFCDECGQQTFGGTVVLLQQIPV